MADGVIDEKTIAERMGQYFLGYLSENLSGTFTSGLQGAASKVFGDDAAKTVESLASQTKDAKSTINTLIDTVSSGVSQLEKFAASHGVEIAIGADVSEAFDKLKSLPGFLKQNDLEQIAVTLGVDVDKKAFEDAAGSALKALEPLLNARAIGEGIIAPKAILSLRGFSQQLASTEAVLMELDRAAGKANMGFLNDRDIRLSGEQNDAVATMSKAVSRYRGELKSFNEITGKSSKEFAELTAQANQAGLSFETFSKGLERGIGAAEHSQPVKGFAAVLALAKGVGVEASEVFQDMALYTKSLGLSAEEAAEKYGLFAEVATGTKATQSEVRKAIMSSTQALRYFGDTSKGTARIYKNFLNALGTGQEGLAAELLSKVTSSLEKMDMGMKAFLGTVGGMGTTGSALGSALDVEQAIMEGRGDEVISSVKDQIEKFTGGPLMTFQEAIDTGNREQFVLQREMLKTLGLGVDSDAEANKLMEAMVKGDGASVQLDEKKGLQAVIGTGKDQMAMEVGPQERMANAAEVTAQLGLTENISDKLFTSSQRFTESSDQLGRATDQLVKGLLGFSIKDLKEKAGNFRQLDAKTHVGEAVEEHGIEAARVAEITKEADNKSTRVAETLAETNRSSSDIKELIDASAEKREAVTDTTKQTTPIETNASTPEEVRNRVDVLQKEATGPEASVREPDTVVADTAMEDVSAVSETEQTKAVQQLKEVVAELVKTMSVQRDESGNGNVEVRVYIGDQQLKDIVNKEIRKDFQEKQAKGAGKN